VIQPTFASDDTYLPVTTQQFQDLTNEILAEVNKLTDPNFLDAEYMAQILVAVIHGLKREQGIVNKTTLFQTCVNRISCQLTFNINQEIQARIKQKAKDNGETLEGEEIQVTHSSAIPLDAQNKH
jgi:hypothetical protein